MPLYQCLAFTLCLRILGCLLGLLDGREPVILRCFFFSSSHRFRLFALGSLHGVFWYGNHSI